ncbi:MAG: MFS transporter [Kineosporiaceae bacterium]|nr:MFS transporter [Kineosporiaceae bacterium]MBK7622478.1 MFS transporter [Kineosporiaceae bacterium]MBK8078392.1 MFS transporter [Kineosporiaceae bacterium]
MSPWASHPFRWLVVGRTVDAFGNAIGPVALAFAVLRLGGSATQLGLVMAVYAGLDVVTSLAAGVLGDRWSRRALMVWTSALLAVVQGAVAVTWLLGRASIGLLGVAAAGTAVLSALRTPSAEAILSQTVPREALPTAITWRRLAANTALTAGFAVGGILVAVLGPGWAIAVDALTFVIAAGCYAQVRVGRWHTSGEQTGGEPASGTTTSMLTELREGFAEVFSRTWLWLMLLQAMIYHLLYGGVQGVLGPLVVRRDHGEATWGWAMAALMAGFILGGLVCLRYRPRRLLLTGTLFLAGTAAFPLALALPADGAVGVAVIIVGAFGHGFGLEVFSVQWDTAIQTRVPPDKLARVMSLDAVGSFVMRPIGLAVTGPISALVGVRSWLLVVAAVMFVVDVAPVAAPSVRDLTRT